MDSPNRLFHFPLMSRWSLIPTMMAAVIVLFSGACVSHSPASIKPSDWHNWKDRRFTSVAGTNGWSTLVGLFWLPEGTSSLGSSPTNTFVLSPQLSPPSIGQFHRVGTNVEIVMGAVTARLVSDANGAEPTIINSGSLHLYLIQRGERLGIRVKSPNAPTRLNFEGLDYYPYQPIWRIPAQFVPAPKGATVSITDVTGDTKAEPVAGTVTFSVGGPQGQQYQLLALNDDETHDLWIIFRDSTAGKTTHGGGRFLHLAKPTSDGRVILDFNYAYNPPCAFTPFATCPLPPAANRLSLAIPAGEKKYRGEKE